MVISKPKTIYKFFTANNFVNTCKPWKESPKMFFKKGTENEG